MSGRLTIKGYHINKVEYGEENRVRADGHMTLSREAVEKYAAKEPLIESVRADIVPPFDHERHTNTIMDIIPVSAKALGKLGEGITHTLTGLYIVLTGVDTNGRQVCNGGSSDGIMEERICWGRPGTPLRSDWLIHFEVTVKADAWASRSGPDAIHRVCDRLCQEYREQLKKFNGYACTEAHHFDENYREGQADVVIIKEVSGQGAVYDTRMFGSEPGGFQGGRSVIDMGCMPVLLTPNEYRDGILRAMD